MTIRVILGEDSYLASEGVARVLDRADDIQLLSTQKDFDALVAAFEEQRPDVVLTDIRMPPTHSDEGIRLADELRASSPEIGIVVLSQHAEPAYVTALLEEGSEGRAYLLKEHVKDAGELERAVRAVAAGGSVIDPIVVESLLQSHRRLESAQLGLLTPREFQILGLIAEGRSNASIAEHLVLTKRAVERHINAIFLKLELGEPEDVSRRVGAALIYLAAHDG